MILKDPFENSGPTFLDLPFNDVRLGAEDKYLVRHLGDIPTYCDPKTGAVVMVHMGGDHVLGEIKAQRAGRRLKSGERGIILAPLVRVKEGKVGPRRVHPTELRSALMFWDHIDIPSTNMLPVDLSGDLQFLADEGILRQTRLEVSGWQIPHDVVCRTHTAALSAAETVEPSKWSLGRIENSPHLARGILNEDSGILVRLFDTIPIPDQAVPLNDILQFKSKREAELKNLQYHLECMYERIVNAPDRGHAEERELAALDRALVDYIKSLREAPFRKVLGRIDASLDLPQAFAAAGSAVAAFAQGLPLAQALVAGGAALSVSLGFGRKEKSVSSNPFEYVACYRRELF